MRVIFDAIRDVIPRGPVRRAARPLWRNTNSLPDLCDLTALWLDGQLASTPHYYGRVDVDEDIAPGITDALLALNWAGFLTDNSQGAYDGDEYPTAPWEAWVSGFADAYTFDWLTDALRDAGHRDQAGTHHPLLWYAYRPANSTGRWRDRRPIGTVPAGRRYGRMSAREITSIYGLCGDGAVDALLDAWRVTVYDPQPGCNDMWAELRRAAEERQ